MPHFHVHNSSCEEKSAEAGVYPVEGSTLWEMEQKDNREVQYSTQLCITFPFVVHIHTSHSFAESQSYRSGGQLCVCLR